MLNYIWMGLLVIGIGVALTTDIADKIDDKYRSGDEINIELIIDAGRPGSSSGSVNAKMIIGKNEFDEFYNTAIDGSVIQPSKIKIDTLNNNSTIYFKIQENAPIVWQEMAEVSGEKNDLTGRLINLNFISPDTISAKLILEKVSFVKMKEVTNAAIDYAGTAVEIALGLIGIMALWLGIMKIAEEAGLIKKIANSVKPITRFLFPGVPQDHPAISAMVMNISANMLGLGNAATPFGLKAMEELDKLNPEKGTATNAMCTFLAINTAGLTLIPATAIAIRAAAGSANPAIIIGTSFFGALCATAVGITSAKILEKFPMSIPGFVKKLRSHLRGLLVLLLVLLLFVLGFLTGIWSDIFSVLGFIDADLMREIIEVGSMVAIPLLIILFVVYGFIKKVKVYEVFIEGAKEGFNIAVKIIPYLVAMLVAIGIFRAGGAMEFLVAVFNPFTSLIGMPAEALPMAFMRPLSGSGSLGIMAEIISVHGPDSFIGILVSTIMGSTETTFYVLAVYFGVVNVKRTRHAVAAGLLADLAGVLGAVFIVHLLFG